MATVRTIPAVRKVGNTARTEETPKLRVAAYCRVSTETDEQATSYEAQIEHYTEYIQQNPSWTFAGIYADDGISGTDTKKREEFNRLIDDCMAGRIDMVVTKSISRFARNTLDCLNYIRKLKEKNIPVYFEKEGINTLDAKGEVMLTIMASLAQQESQSLSQNVKLGLQYRYQQGKVQVCTKRFLGYDKDENGKLVINPEQAEVVKRIYREFLEGKSYYEIGKGLTADGIKTGAGSDFWLVSTLKKILQNEKYIGDALLQKTVTTDFLTKKRVENKGIAPQYYVEGSHEAIIPRDIYMMVQEEILRRKDLKTVGGKRRIFSSKYALSSNVFCGCCGELYQRTHWNIHGRKKIVWRCVSRLHKKNTEVDCPARTVSEADLHTAVMNAINRVFEKKDAYLPQLKENVRKVISDNGAVTEIDRQLTELEQQILKRTMARQPCDDLGQEVIRLREEKHRLQVENAEKENVKQRVAELEEAIDELGREKLEYDETLVRRLIEKVTVYDDSFTVEFKSGLDIDVQL